MKHLIGIMGGTFDPPHLGHTTVAIEIKNFLKLEKIYLMPNHIPPHKAPATAEERHRIAMIRILAEENDNFEYLDTEIRMNKTSYLSETMNIIANSTPFSDKSIFFIIGTDSLVNLHKWHAPDEILRYCNIAVASRPGYDVDRCSEQIKKRIVSIEKLDPQINGQIVLVSTSRISISSTELRNSPEAVTCCNLHPRVLDYIKRHHLYNA